MASSLSPSHQRQSAFVDQAVAGAASGFVTRMLTAPFDTLKIRNQVLWSDGVNQTPFQAMRTIINQEGPLALWKGSIPALYLWMSYAFVQFGVYETTRKLCQPVLGDASSFVAGASSAVLATTVTYPFDLLRTQFAVQGKQRVHLSMLSFIKYTMQSYGLKGMFVGLRPSVVGVAPYMGLNFFLYETFRKWVMQLRESYQLDGAVTLGLQGSIGGLAGVISKLCVYPLDTVKRRIQLGVIQSTLQHQLASADHFAYKTIGACISGIWRQEGIAGFYRGLYPALLKAGSSTGVAFLSYEGAKALLLKLRESGSR